MRLGPFPERAAALSRCPVLTRSCLLSEAVTAQERGLSQATRAWVPAHP